MTPDERSNDFFGHLDQPVPPTPRRIDRPDDDEFAVPDPFGAPKTPPAQNRPPSGNHPRPAPRPPTSENPVAGAPKGPGLSPGIPRVNQPPKHEAPRSGVVLTPGGVKRLDQTPSGPQPQRPPSGQAPQRRTPSGPAPQRPPTGQSSAGQAPEFHEASRQRNDADDVSWEEYAASDFPAMAAEEFGVKTKMSDSGRVVPVAVRADLTPEAMQGKSIKGGGRPRPVTTESRRPRSFMQRISDSLRRKEAAESDEDSGEEGGTKGFAKSGSQPAKKRKKSPARVVWNLVSEVAKILLLVLLLRAYVVQVSEVTGPSMQPTLEQKDRLVVERITPLFSGHKHGDEWWIKVVPAFMRPELERGDLVVVRSPEDPGLELVKRLIGLPGDTLRFEDGKLFLKPAGGSEFAQVNEDYIQVDDPDLMNPDGTRRSYKVNDLGGYLHEGEELRVPEKRLFLMGDNRTRSNDSRRWLQIEVRTSETPGVDRLWVHTTSVEGVVLFRLWPFDRIWPPVK